MIGQGQVPTKAQLQSHQQLTSEHKTKKLLSKVSLSHILCYAVYKNINTQTLM